MSIKVKDVLNRPLFENTKILTGKKGLDREVKWVHIVEVSRFGHLLNGHEIILTTGVGWANDEEKSLSYLQQLLDYNVSALFIELLQYSEEIPEKMLLLAEEHDFPIVLFKQEVRFIEITKDLHELLLGYHEEFWWKLENLHNELNKQLLSDGDVRDFLRILHKKSNKQIALKYNEQYYFFPSPSIKKRDQLINDIELNGKNKYLYNVHKSFEQNISSLYYLESKDNIDQFDEIALKRCNEIISQYFWKHYQQHEIHQMIRNKWIFDAIIGNLTPDEIVTNIQQEFPGVKIMSIIIGVNPIKTTFSPNEDTNNLEATHIIHLRPILLKFGFELLTLKDDTRSNYIFLLLNKKSNNIKKRLEQALEYLYVNDIDPLIHNELKWISFGKAVTDYKEIGISYDTAISTLNYQRNIKILKKPFYENLGVYRIIEQMSDKDNLKEIVSDYLGPLLIYDRDKGTELLKTLQAYFENAEAKKETADELHIVRQTLYHRLNRIESLIGEDFLNSENRFMMEFSIHALKYIES